MKKSAFVCILICLCLCFSGCSTDPLKKVSKDLNEYSIEATLNEDFSVDGVEEVTYKNQNLSSVEKLYFNLYPRAFREDAKVKPYSKVNEGKCFPAGISYGDLQIIDVTVCGSQATYNYVGEDENALEVVLPSALKEGEETKVKICFKLIIPEATHRFSHYLGSVNLGNWYPILAKVRDGEPIIEPYYSTGDPFFSDIANYNVKFNYFGDYFLSSSGNMVKSELKDGLKSEVLEARAVRDFAIALTSEECVRQKKVDDVLVSYVGYEGDEDADANLETSIKALKFFSSSFGEFPYSKLDVVKAPFLHGGMEYPSIVLISDTTSDPTDIARVIVHEIAHQWWYAVVGNNEIEEAWLDESLAEYSSALFFEKHNEYGLSYQDLVDEAFAGYVLYADILSTLLGKVDTNMLKSVDEYAGEYEYVYVIYVRGVLMFDAVRQQVGAQKMIDGFKKYYSECKFKIATSDDFIAYFSKGAKKDIESIFDSWLSGSALVGVI